MRKWLAIFLVTLVLLVVFKDWATYANFYINQDYIAQNLCVNKSEPVPMCSGKCYLEAELAQNHEGSEEEPLRVSEDKRSITTYLLPEVLFQLKMPLVSRTKKALFFIESHYAFSFLNKVFRPPGFICS